MLAPGALVAYAKSGHQATGIPGLPGAVGLKEEGNLSSLPGDPVKGLAVFRAFCSGCHNFKAAGLQGQFKSGSDLDDRKPTYSKIVTLIVQGGGGGAPSKRLLQELTYEEIYDVAKFVALYAGKPGPVKGATLKPPAPVELSAPLQTTGAAGGPAGRFTGTLSGTALRWKIVVQGQKGTKPLARIRFTGADASLQQVPLDCERCIQPGEGFVVVSQAQAKALGTGRAVLVVSEPSGKLSGQIKPA
jgi:hypothetical protein